MISGNPNFPLLLWGILIIGVFDSFLKICAAVVGANKSQKYTVADGVDAAIWLTILLMVILT